jgi:hypothetical protein
MISNCRYFAMRHAIEDYRLLIAALSTESGRKECSVTFLPAS